MTDLERFLLWLTFGMCLGTLFWPLFRAWREDRRAMRELEADKRICVLCSKPFYPITDHVSCNACRRAGKAL